MAADTRLDVRLRNRGHAAGWWMTEDGTKGFSCPRKPSLFTRFVYWLFMDLKFRERIDG